MIPKIIHYIWFGGNELPAMAKDCIQSWKKYCPEYEIICWNEETFDLNYNQYVREAYQSKKWAFVSDVVRLYALVNFGGIYMDTDVELIDNLDSILEYSAVSGFESETGIPTGLMASEKGNIMFKELLDDYNSRKFINNDGTLNTTTNVIYITNTCLKYGLKLNGKKQTINTFTLLPVDYLCPKDYVTGEINLTENTIAIHHFNASWQSEKYKKWILFERKMFDKFGYEKGYKIVHIKAIRFLKYVYVDGLEKAITKFFEQMKGVK